MITLRLPSAHPNSGIMQRWATDKESIITNHSKDIQRLQGVLKTILTNNPGLGKAT